MQNFGVISVRVWGVGVGCHFWHKCMHIYYATCASFVLYTTGWQMLLLLYCYTRLLIWDNTEQDMGYIYAHDKNKLIQNLNTETHAELDCIYFHSCVNSHKSLNEVIQVCEHRGSIQPSERFVFCLQQQTVCPLNDHCSANGHVSLINSNSSFIAHSLGDIEDFCVMKKTLWAPPSLFTIANTPICRLLPFSERSL